MATKEVVKITTPFFRASFAHVFKPTSFKGQEPKYSVQMLFPKDADLSEMKKAASQAIRDKWGNDKTKWPQNLRNPFKDGNKKNLEDYKDKTVVEARSKFKPGIIDGTGREIIDPQEFYSGCWARATVTVYAYDMAGNCGVAFGLQNLQKWKDDKAFSGKKNAKDDFEIIEGVDGGSADFESGGQSEDDIDF